LRTPSLLQSGQSLRAAAPIRSAGAAAARVGYWDHQTDSAAPSLRYSTLQDPALVDPQLTDEPGSEIPIGPADVPLPPPVDGQPAPPSDNGVDAAPPLPTVNGQPVDGTYPASPLGGGAVAHDFTGLGFAPVVPSRWYVGGAGLMFWREGRDDQLLAYDDAQPAVPLLDADDNRPGLMGGFEVWFGRYLSDSWAIEARYWGLFPPEQQVDLFASDLTGNLNGGVLFTGLDYDNGGGAAPADDFFTATQMLRNCRNFNYHNVEVNFLHNTCPFPNPCCRGQFVWLLGARYLQLDEDFCLGSDFTSEAFGDDPANELFYTINVENRLVGFQLGGIWERCLAHNFALRVASKGGIFANDIDYSQRLNNGAGVNATVNNGPFAGQDFDITDDKIDVSFVGELFAGGSYQISPRWRATAGYRAVFATGVATPLGQIPNNYADLGSVLSVDADDSLVLHGAVVGAEYTW
jgi:hypothetical protein